MYRSADVDFDVTQEMRVRSFLASVLEKPEREWRLLNTLSLLEHIGSRKILQSHLRVVGVCGGVLKHLAEETRHAAFLKKAAETIAGRSLGFSPAELLGYQYVRSYLDRLDALITREVSRPNAYSNMSYVIEVRALWFYTLYHEVSAALGRAPNLKGLIAEERRHLDQMAERIRATSSGASQRLSSFLLMESGLFKKLLMAMEHTSMERPQ